MSKMKTMMIDIAREVEKGELAGADWIIKTDCEYLTDWQHGQIAEQIMDGNDFGEIYTTNDDSITKDWELILDDV